MQHVRFRMGVRDGVDRSLADFIGFGEHEGKERMKDDSWISR